MAVLQIVDNAVNTLVDTIETIFTNGTSGVLIESFTAVNNSSVNASYKAYIVNSGVAQPQIPMTIVVWGENDLGIGIVNQVIPANATLRVEASAANSIYFTVTGREV
tara:strand:- start:521 stop:841 length:321 start_codon:yes stop_codon:yes gene_type:complete